jgi:hypothetical protein
MLRPWVGIVALSNPTGEHAVAIVTKTREEKAFAADFK